MKEQTSSLPGQRRIIGDDDAALIAGGEFDSSSMTRDEFAYALSVMESRSGTDNALEYAQKQLGVPADVIKEVKKTCKFDKTKYNEALIERYYGSSKMA